MTKTCILRRWADSQGAWGVWWTKDGYCDAATGWTMVMRDGDGRGIAGNGRQWQDGRRWSMLDGRWAMYGRSAIGDAR